MAKKQTEIPGTERTQISDVERAAEAYREAHDERMELSKSEASRKLDLLAAMQAAKIKTYRYSSQGVELEVVVDDEPKVKVRKTGEEDDFVGDPMPAAAIPLGLIAEAERSMVEDVDAIA